jgi:hypothetical protein
MREPQIFPIMSGREIITGTKMNDGQDQCPYCRQVLEIVCVKFVALGARTVSRCPNCALAPTKPVTKPGSSSAFSRAIKMIQALNSRFKIVMILAFAAVLVAGILRHTLHVYGGIEPADIRSDTLLLLSAIAIVVVVFKVSRRR